MQNIKLTSEKTNFFHTHFQLNLCPFNFLLEYYVFRSNKGSNNVEKPSKGTYSRLETSSQILTKNSGIEKHSVLLMDHPLDHFYEPHH